MKLLTKFNLILLVVFGTGDFLISQLSLSFLIGNARDEVGQEARLMMAGATAVRDYTSGDISQLLQENPKHRVRFIPETIPAYAATVTFSKLRKDYPDYAYKEAALNPTNLEDRAADWESDIIHALRDHPDEPEATGDRPTPTGASFYIARPIRAKQECLGCHSVPSAAPHALLAVYGSSNGFGWKNGEIVGAQIVSVPISVPLAVANGAYHKLLYALIFITILAILAIDAGVYWFVTRPLKTVSQTADRVSRGEKDVPPIEIKGRDEIAIVAASFNRMQMSLSKALKMFEEG